MTLRGEVQIVLCACFDPTDPHHPRDRRIFSADPLSVVSRIAEAQSLTLDAARIGVIAAFLSHPTNAKLMDLIINVAAAEEDVASAVGVARPAFWLTVIAHNTLFYLGTALLAFGIVGLCYGTDWLGAIFSAGGVGASLGTLLRGPVRGLQESLATRIQLELISNGYRKEIGIWKSYAAFADQQADLLLVDATVSFQIRRSAERALSLIEFYCKPNDKLSPMQIDTRYLQLNELAQADPGQDMYTPPEDARMTRRPNKPTPEKLTAEKLMMKEKEKEREHVPFHPDSDGPTGHAFIRPSERPDLTSPPSVTA